MTCDYGTPQRGAILDEVRNVLNDRQDMYGNPEDSFKLVASYWSIYLQKRFEIAGIILTNKDISMLMTLFKIAREQNQDCRDNLIDAIGYIALAGDMEDK